MGTVGSGSGRSGRHWSATVVNASSSGVERPPPAAPVCYVASDPLDSFRRYPMGTNAMLQQKIRRLGRSRLLRLEPLEQRMLLTGGLVIGEFMASNETTLADEDGDFEDWIEIHNPTGAAIDLTGWSLTDDPGDLSKWLLPARTLPAGDYLLVFASGKDRRDPGGELHANFQLDADGEYLALVEPGGTTVATEFSPAFRRKSRTFRSVLRRT